MEEYTGQLMGGPDDGNLVTASVTRIPTVDVLSLWLDGTGEDKESTVIQTSGFYNWDSERQCFIWQRVANQVL